MPNTMFPKYYTETLTTKRGPVSGGKRTAPVAYITTPVRCSVVLPLDSTAQQEVYLRGVSVDHLVFCDPADIVPEDVITINSVDFVVVEVASWPRTEPRVLQISLREYQKP